MFNKLKGIISKGTKTAGDIVSIQKELNKLKKEKWDLQDNLIKDILSYPVNKEDTESLVGLADLVVKFKSDYEIIENEIKVKQEELDNIKGSIKSDVVNTFKKSNKNDDSVDAANNSTDEINN
ncbi:hypothetical protein DEFDS_P233 (plasmid) [Deferribacter desulfuricans SSM1]|uniref:Uncharacterized protein n=1 Tax=Deferribacter desulfuricans (strain DSM 14783 / JCM 11476 / NBRC 101012 / SSM1) TaxID=639282 RepID=D3PF61_DEFDS|nr:hypothetical protein [Deferribacter desulfuricans]BAI81853.1 hypothetical protein DEFDS_P233 [Deferribacter desulfuricans SSM1]